MKQLTAEYFAGILIGLGSGVFIGPLFLSMIEMLYDVEFSERLRTRISGGIYLVLVVAGSIIMWRARRRKRDAAKSYQTV